MAPPRQKPHRSEQTVETPADFLAAVVSRFGPLDADLACTVENKKAPMGYTFPEFDALDSLQDWATDFGEINCWLNPPFTNIGAWVRKCAEQGRHFTTGRILLLVPASVGSEWFREHVYPSAYVLTLSPRLKFVGHASSYPKDLMLCIYGAGLRGFDCWRWDAGGASRISERR